VDKNKLNNKTNLLAMVLLSMVLLFSINSFSQTKKNKNLIPNPSFEIHKNQSGSIGNAIPWKGIGTVDYYTKPDKKDTSKYKGAHTGNCYGGLRFQPDYKEYMYVALDKPLKKNKTYHFKMYVRLNESSTVTIKQLGVYFSEEAFKVGMIFNNDGLVDSMYKKGLTSIGWLAIEGNYKAKGTEKYIIIGNFRTKMKDDMVKKNKLDIFETLEAYYFIDDISLYERTDIIDSTEIEEDAPALPDWIDNSIASGSSFEIPNLQFEKNTANIIEPSYPSLDDVVALLKAYPLMEIQINGHTDDFGDDAAEHQLSKDRAKAVYDYFKLREVTNTMTYKGLGATQPIAPNDAEIFKEKNRRIEIVIVNGHIK
jgi:OOP family OmpA-OmpF porin